MVRSKSVVHADAEAARRAMGAVVKRSWHGRLNGDPHCGQPCWAMSMYYRSRCIR